MLLPMTKRTSAAFDVVVAGWRTVAAEVHVAGDGGGHAQPAVVSVLLVPSVLEKLAGQVDVSVRVGRF